MTSSGERGRTAPLVTVVVSCGCQTGAVELMLRSVCAQTTPSFEILAFNLGCPSAFFAKVTGDERIRAVETGEDVAGAWNLATAQSSARYIIFLEPGDTMEETCLEKCLFHLETASLDLCGSWRMRGAGLHRTGPFTLQALLERNASGPAVIRKETLIRAGGFDRAIEPSHLSWDLWIRMAERGARGRVLPEPLIRSFADPFDEVIDTAFVRGKYSHLLEDQNRVGQLDSMRVVKSLLSGYDRLLEGARQAPTPGIVVAMPYLAMGGAERAMSVVFGELARRGFRIYLVTTEEPPPCLGDSSDWFLGSVAGLYRLPQLVPPNVRPAFFSYLIQRHSIQVLLQVGSEWVYRWLPRLKELFAELVVVDILFNPAGHVESYSKSRELIDHVVVEHQGMATWLANHGDRSARISVIPNAVDVARFAPRPPRDWLTKGPRREGTFVVGFFGRLSEEKAPDTFLRIAERFRDRPSFQFLVCGIGPLETSLRALRERLGLEETVRFLGFVDTSEYLACCDVTVVCSRLDGRPNIILESLAMGVPVVASRVGGIPEMAPEGYGSMLCAADDVDGFCAAIEHMASDKEGYLKLAAAGRQRVTAQHWLTDAANEYAQLFASLMEVHPRAERSAADEAAIAAAMLPAVRQYRRLPTGRRRAAFRIVRHALSWSNASGSLLTLCLYIRIRLDRAATDQLAQFFDVSHYARQRPDVEAAKVPMLWHYLLMGFREGADPSPLFDTDYYLGTNPDVIGAGVNPLVHYIKVGRAEGRGRLSPWDCALA